MTAIVLGLLIIWVGNGTAAVIAGILQIAVGLVCGVSAVLLTVAAAALESVAWLWEVGFPGGLLTSIDD